MKKYLLAQDFAVFLEIWNMLQGYKTPLFHYKMADWFQGAWESNDKRLLLMAFRASGKSTLCGLFSAWLLWRNPDLRILVLAAESSLATKMVRNIRKILEKHPVTSSLVPQRADQWASDRFTINRNRELRDPSVLAAGIMSNITGSRADIIIYDDVEVPNNCNTMQKRISLRERLKESTFVLTAGGTQLYIGTPHSYFSIYADEPRDEIDESNIFLEGFKRYEQPILNEKNLSVWPENFSQEDIELIRTQSGPNKFASQMMLRPVNITQGRLNVDLLQNYDEEIVIHEAQQHIYLFLKGKKLVSCSAWWDPAFGSAKGDSSVFAVMFTDEEGTHYLHHLSYIQVKEGEPLLSKGESREQIVANEKNEGNDDELPSLPQDEATIQCRKLCEIIERYLIPSVRIETNGIGKFLPAILRRELARKNLPCAVVEYSNHQPKHLRILEAFDAVMAAKALFVHEKVRATPFLSEMMEWQPTHKGQKDDGLDAVAGALSSEPVRIKRFYSNALKKWSGAKMLQQAKTEFEV